MRIALPINLFKDPWTRRASEMIVSRLFGVIVYANILYLKDHPDTPDLYDAGVIYKRENGEQWKTIPECIADGYADCEDLSAWLVAQYIVRKGIQARGLISKKCRGKRCLYHVRCRLPNGTIEDPSKILGM